MISPLFYFFCAQRSSSASRLKDYKMQLCMSKAGGQREALRNQK
jgi:hypothetical protein